MSPLRRIVALLPLVSLVSCTHFTRATSAELSVGSTVRADFPRARPLTVQTASGVCQLQFLEGKLRTVTVDSLYFSLLRKAVPATPADTACRAARSGVAVTRAQIENAALARKHVSPYRTLGMLFGIYLGLALLVAAFMVGGLA